MAEVRTSSVDKHTRDGELSVQLCNYTDVYRNDKVRPSPDLMRATATSDEIDRFRLQIGDSVLTKDSEDPNDIGISAHVADTASDFVCGYHLAIARPSPGTHPRYLTWALRSRPVLDHFSNHASGISRYGLTTAGLRAAPVPWHDELEQRRIADFLDDRVARIDQIITARRAQIWSLDDAARATLAERMLLGEEQVPLRHLILDERLGLWGSEVGEDDVDVYVARVADFERAEFRLGDVPTVRSAAAAQIATRALRHGDVLLERSGGTNINPVGCPAFVEDPAPNTVSSNFVSRLRPVADADGRYLSLLLGALYATGQQRPHANQTTGIQNLDTTSYLHVRIPIRCPAEQVSLAQKVDNALSGIRGQQRHLRESAALLEEYKHSLITAAVTGEIDVTTAGSGIPG
ncbi:hypothetical protein GCM10009810_36250 [Nostocoides vanveenii]|uniref:Restriction endonuclease subunit S n=2 Tax=Nostocoides vanveenii TaxID=330835 RepID=A0ABP4XE54_9MICO